MFASFRAAVAGATAVLLLAGLTGCGSGDDSSTPAEGPSSSKPTSTASVEGSGPPLVTTVVKVGTIAGQLKQKDRQAFKKRVSHAVDQWFDGAYVAGPYPRKGTGHAFQSFTPGAAKLAYRQRKLTSNAGIASRIDGVQATRRWVKIDVLAPHGVIAAATAHVKLRFKTTGQVERKVFVKGRLFLTRNGKGRWKVFGFDISKGKA